MWDLVIPAYLLLFLKRKKIGNIVVMSSQMIGNEFNYSFHSSRVNRFQKLVDEVHANYKSMYISLTIFFIPRNRSKYDNVVDKYVHLCSSHHSLSLVFTPVYKSDMLWIR